MTHALLKINDLELSVNLGWPEEERATQQIVMVSLEIFFNTPPKACLSDQLSDTFCYDDLIQHLTHQLAQKQFRLIEHLAHEIYLQVKKIVNHQVIVHLNKKPNIAGLMGGVCFSYGDKP